jgi:acyl dehydratase
MSGRYLEDFVVGQTFGSGRLRIDEEQAKAFAAEFDPQPFHLDAEAARKSIFSGLAVSGWHTAALTMRLLVDSELKPAGGIVGAGFDEFRWPLPVRPGPSPEMTRASDHGVRLRQENAYDGDDGP